MSPDTAAMRRELEDIVERALDLLDLLDGDADEEPTLGWCASEAKYGVKRPTLVDGELEPSLGGTASPYGGSGDDREKDDADPEVATVFDGAGHAWAKGMLARRRGAPPVLTVVK